MKRKIAILLCLAMLIALLSGCRYLDEPIAAPEGDTSTTASDSPETDDSLQTQDQQPIPSEDITADNLISTVIDYDTAFNTYAADTVMVRAGDYEITWEELFFFIHGSIENLISTIGTIDSWSEIQYGELSFEEMIMADAIEIAAFYNCLEYGVDAAGITLNEDQSKTMTEQYTSAVNNNGGEEAFLKILWEEDGIHSKELYDYLVAISTLANHYFSETYGQYGEKLSDEDIAEYTAFEGYLMAKHILCLKPDHRDHDTTVESAVCDECIEGSSNALANCEELLAMIDDSQAEGEEFEEYFDELMTAHSEDTGLASFPNGYLFQNGDMVNEFYIACNELEIGGYSEIVETTYGYHIIHRIPVNYDVTPISASNYGDYRSLREITAYSMFDSALLGWKDLLTLDYTEAYDSMDFSSIFSLDKNK